MAERIKRGEVRSYRSSLPIVATVSPGRYQLRMKRQLPWLGNTVFSTILEVHLKREE